MVPTIPSWFIHKSHISMTNIKDNLYCYHVVNSIYQGAMSMCTILKWEDDWTIVDHPQTTQTCELTTINYLKYLHNHSYNEKRGSVSPLPRLCIWPSKNLTIGWGQDIKINYISLHPALHNCSLARKEFNTLQWILK